MLPYIPPPRPVSGWDYAGLAAAAFAGVGAIAAGIWTFFALMPVGERAIHFIVGAL